MRWRARGAGLFAPALLLVLGMGGFRCAGADADGGDPAPAFSVARKRAAPAAVAPVARDGVRYEVVHWGKARGLAQNGGYVAAVDEDSGEELWLLRVYETVYDEGMEGDKQDVFITRLRVACRGACLEVEDERGREYRVDLASHAVTSRNE